MILEIILICIIALCGFIIYRQDQTIKRQIDYIDQIEIKLLTNFESISNSYKRMKEIDQKGGFESDDEVGQVFNGIKDVLEDLEKDINE